MARKQASFSFRRISGARMSWSIKYNLLVMKDNSTVVRFRLSTAWLQIGAAVLLLLLLLSLGGVVYGIRSHAQNQAIRKDRLTLLSRLGQLEQQIQRLENVESMIGSMEKDDLLFVSLPAATKRPGQMVLPLDLKELFSRTDLNVVSVNNLQAKFAGEELRMSVELNSLQSETTVAGTIQFSVVTRDGHLREMDNDQETAFEVSTYKTFKPVILLPQDIEKEELFAVRMRVLDTSGRMVLSETYPLEQILS
jgi:hypothetical protein